MADGELNQYELEFGEVCYPYYYGCDCIDRIVWELGRYDADRFIVVTDSTVQSLHGDRLIPALARHAPVDVLSLPAGEHMKSMTALAGHLDRAIGAGASRRSVVVAFGGGVPGNLAGMLAAILFRGVRLIHVPTTTVAAMDSVISLKQAINSRYGKNHVGSYHVPEAIYVDVRLLQTLPERELRSGMCEAMKNCLAIRPHSLASMRELLAAGAYDSISALLWLLEESIASKLSVMKDDAREKHAGLVLEYGHTVGHAVELCDHHLRAEDGLSHGEAVALGMVAAARIASALGVLDPDTVAVHDELVTALGAPRRIPDGLDVARVMDLVRADSKRGYLELAEDEAAMVLLEDFGVPLESQELPLVAVPLEVVGGVVDELAADVPASVNAL
jgi:3-dehydroquinate synthetase